MTDRALTDADIRRLSAVLVPALAESVADILEARGLNGETADLVDAATVARSLGVRPNWVRNHAPGLGGVRAGDGPKSPWRFDLAVARQRFTSMRVPAPPPNQRTQRVAQELPALPPRRPRRLAA
jgi:hypothetical protein